MQHRLVGGYPIGKVVRCLTFHFLLSAFAGSLAYWLISTTGGTGAADGISGIGLLAALSCAALSHVAEDYTLDWF